MSNTTVDELKTLYVKLGGNINDVANLQTDAELIDKIEDIVGSKELPAVTSEDNGDILAVVNGAWGKATPESDLPAVTSEDNGSVLQVINGEWNKNNAPYIDDWIPCQVYCGDTIISTLKASYSPSRGVLNISGYIESSNFSSASKGENVMLCSIISGAIKDYSNITKLPQSMCVSCNDLLFLNFSNGNIRFLTATGDDEGMNIIWAVNAIINWTSSELPSDEQIYLSSVNVDGTGKGTWT